MNSIELTVTREPEDDSLDHVVTIIYEPDGCGGYDLWLDLPSAALIGKLTELEYDMAMEAVRERDGEEE